jgi:pyridoxine/pyridoxamine 5'-phosphate oxidase
MQTTIDYLEGRPKRKMRLLLVKCDSSGVLVHLLRSCQKKKSSAGNELIDIIWMSLRRQRKVTKLHCD